MTQTAKAQNYLGLEIKNLTQTESGLIHKEVGIDAIVFSCVPSGIIVLKNGKSIDVVSKKISAIIDSTNKASRIIFFKDYSIELAEKKCAEARNNIIE